MKAGETVSEKKKQTNPGRQRCSAPLNGQKGAKERAAEVEKQDDRCPKQPRLPVNIGGPSISTEFRSRIPSACGLHDDYGEVDRAQ
jgi:hypothetical protein